MDGEFSLDKLNGLIGESPRVVHAIATQTRDEQGNPTYVVVAFIRSPVPAARCAVCEDEQSVHGAAKGLKDTLAKFGIEWSGAFKFCTPEELAKLKSDAQPSPGPIIAS